MTRRKSTVAVTITVGLIAVAGYFVLNRERSQQPSVTTKNRLPELKKLVAGQEIESTQALTKYRPKSQARIDDTGILAADLLKDLPGVVQVEVAVRVEKPTHRIIHLRDWHIVPRNLYAIDLKDAAGRDINAEEMDRKHQELLLEVEAVQLEQLALLRCLIKHHGLRRIYCEGLTAKALPNYRERIAGLRDMEKNELSQLRKQLAEVRELLKGANPNTGRYQEAKTIEDEITGMIAEHGIRLLELGSAGRLLIAGEIDEVLPLDDADLLDKAKPISPEGKVKLDRALLTARRDAQVKTVLSQGSFGLIVLGGAHDLSDSVRRLSGGTCEYIRVITQRFKEFAE